MPLEHDRDRRFGSLTAAQIDFCDAEGYKSTPNRAETVRWSVDLRHQPTEQDPMPQRGAGFLARSREYPERVAALENWLAERPERGE